MPPAAPQTALIGVVDFLSQLDGLRIFGDLLGLAVSGGFFVVPLYAMIQNPQRRGVQGADHRCEQRRQRAVHGRRGNRHRGADRGRARYPPRCS